MTSHCTSFYAIKPCNITVKQEFSLRVSEHNTEVMVGCSQCMCHAGELTCVPRLPCERGLQQVLPHNVGTYPLLFAKCRDVSPPLYKMQVRFPSFIHNIGTYPFTQNVGTYTFLYTKYVYISPSLCKVQVHIPSLIQNVGAYPFASAERIAISTYLYCVFQHIRISVVLCEVYCNFYVSHLFTQHVFVLSTS